MRLEEAGFTSGQGETGGGVSEGRERDVWFWEILSVCFFTGFFQSDHLSMDSLSMAECVFTSSLQLVYEWRNRSQSYSMAKMV